MPMEMAKRGSRVLWVGRLFGPWDGGAGGDRGRNGSEGRGGEGKGLP